jgi:DNA-binding SARP family transcriptional activator
MRFRALGSLQVWDGTSWVGIRAPQQRAVLAILLARAGRVVSTERLVDEIWPDGPPRAAVNTIQTYVLRLRRLFDGEGTGDHDRERDSDRDGDRTLIRKGHGYQLVVAEDDIDIQVFERLVSSGRQALAQGRWAAAAERLSGALALWRGPAMAGVPETPTVTAEAARLELHRVAAFEDQAETRLTLGRHAGLVDELRRLIQEHPFRERMLGQLMLALYRCGRPLDALETYRRGRRLIRDELGVDPGPALRRLEYAIRVDDPNLRVPMPERGPQPTVKAGPPPINTKPPLAQRRAPQAAAANNRPPAWTNTAPPPLTNAAQRPVKAAPPLESTAQPAALTPGPRRLRGAGEGP